MAILERKQWLARRAAAPDERLYRLTESGRLHALGGRDPEVQWSRPWDGCWRIVLFDVPTDRNSQREKLRRSLRERAFGCLQDSVWITPDPVKDERTILAGATIDVEPLILLEARPCAGESDAEIVAGAWNFERINRGYARHRQVLENFPDAPLRTTAAAQSLRHWAERERAAWLESVTPDPLLPQQLLPADCSGRRAWAHRVETLGAAGRLLATFSI